MIRNPLLSILALLPSVCFAEIIEAESEQNKLRYDYNPTEKTATLIGGTTDDGPLDIPETIMVDGEEIPVVAIASGAFVNNENITSFRVGANVTKIESKAFNNCPNVSSLFLYAGSKPIELADDCFEACSLEDLYIDRPIRGAGMSMSVESFANSKTLLSAWIKGNVDFLTSGTFANCPALYVVEIKESDTPLTIDMDVWPQSYIQYVGCYRNLNMPTGNPFADNASLRRVNLGGNMTYVNPGLFKGCRNAYVNILYDGIIEIGENAFNGCAGFDNVQIPGTVTKIGDSAFAGCTGLTEVVLWTSVPPAAQENTFDEVIYANALLAVPVDGLDAYMSATCWKNFKNHEGYDNSGIEDITSEDKTPVGYYTLFGIRSDRPIEGQMNIVVFSDGSVKKIKY